ncbi:hypothetical protein V7F78_01850 [Cutibacterium avidum]|uniref:Uncharacterized protein n=1 Tax=Cutibacterium avidum TaxID=33010 RepID=A0AB35XFC8_9ACTN|nr:hypothetical protein [Cutibacterium avidum]MBS6330904.1 hypothetical protein [Propionibacterium sp.]MCO6673283.1 hypothetical protein [Cutibacterium avidum]MCO6675052.1 hypothetical protein [Cutibacterium avidum]MCO6679953.1 hypothetical protein [Cutibacterium avidum]MDU1359221.1 hypothetical protein [Cutibacterium avidum]
MLHVPCRVGVAGFEEGLDLVEQCRFDEGLVGSGVECSFVADDPGVVGVGQQLVQRVAAEWFGGALRRRDSEESAGGEVAQQLDDGGLASCVGLECPSDQRRTLGVDLDGADFPSLVVGAADVEVADGGSHGGAALGDLLRHALGDFGGQVAAVELRDGGHDAVDKHP